ncbi:N-terminal phage integrase SAM-like domain-containing protein [Hyphomicrobium nitrativorans]|uniref:N-terminal phage integrase SAM-like domain-containing protein n=1 Tax=Hyphomicrobium nitrativorans TaxID=1427356 RepID=UPI00130DDD94|nr:N-terminal phage integrase SAM-like domain-containing protein [Hyphomicrobium nitrativorans]
MPSKQKLDRRPRRGRCRPLWGQIHSGVNIVAVREAKRNQPTIEELCERFLEEHSRRHNKPATGLGYERSNRNHIIPLLGGRTVAAITRTDIEDFKRNIRDGITSKRTRRRREGGTGGLDVRGGPGAANRTLGQLSKMFNRESISNHCSRPGKKCGALLGLTTCGSTICAIHSPASPS